MLAIICTYEPNTFMFTRSYSLYRLYAQECNPLLFSPAIVTHTHTHTEFLLLPDPLPCEYVLDDVCSRWNQSGHWDHCGSGDTAASSGTVVPPTHTNSQHRFLEFGLDNGFKHAIYSVQCIRAPCTVHVQYVY